MSKTSYNVETVNNLNFEEFVKQHKGAIEEVELKSVYEQITGKKVSKRKKTVQKDDEIQE